MITIVIMIMQIMISTLIKLAMVESSQYCDFAVATGPVVRIRIDQAEFVNETASYKSI